MNNDRFKFRVWKPDWKQYDNDNYLSQNGVLVYAEVDEDGYSGLFCDGDDGVIEQCTGLRDKTGQLIYEGDVVNAKWGPNIIKSAVVKHKRSGAFILEDGGRPMITVDEVHDIEIIGNIHEAKWGIEREVGNAMNAGNTESEVGK